jgi:hypothetical protein
MPKKCKDCDPNKYIEGLAWRGKNGISYDGYTLYNDVGKPSSTDITLADVSDLVDAYNPIFSASTTYPNPLPESPSNKIKIRGVDKSQGFWFVWSLVNGLVMYGSPGVALTAASITSAATASARIGQTFLFNITLDQAPSYLNYTDFGIFADANSTDRLRFTATSNATIPFTKTTVNYVGYYTGIIESILNGNKYVTTGTGKNKKSQLQTFKASKSLTIVSRDQNGNNPIYTTSAPTIHALKGQSFSYTLTTNLPSNQFNAYLDESSLNTLQNLGLTWDFNNKTITGTVSNNLSSEIKTTILNFNIAGPNADAGNRTSFSLSILYGLINNSIPLPTISNKTFSGTVGSKLSGGTIAGLNNRQTILAVSNLPEGLVFNSTNKTITGTPKHAGTFLAYASCSNARGSSSKATLTFNFGAYSANNRPAGSTYPSEITLPNWNIDVVKNNKITINLASSADGDDIISFKKINTSEFETIRKNGKPDNITYRGKFIPNTTFSPGQGESAETCFWIQIDDPTKGGRNPQYDISVDGNYAITYYSSNQKDLVGNVCYTPDANNSGPASTPVIESLSVTATNTIKGSLSANPAENVPTITISPTQVEHEVHFMGYDPRDNTGGALETQSSVANQTLSKSGRLKYPNGIPSQNSRTYKFYVTLADTCTFNKSYDFFLMFFGTYTPRAGDVYVCSYTSYSRNNKSLRGRNYTYTENFRLTNSTVPGNCSSVVSRAGDKQQKDDYAYRYGNILKNTKDVGISSLTNISILDIIGEGPVEGIVDYEIVPNPGFVLGDIGYKNGVKIVRYPEKFAGDKSALLRSVYWNEIPIADNTYPQQGSLNFEFIQFKYDYGDSAPRHSNLSELSNIKLEEPFYARKVNNGQYVEYLNLKNDSTGQTLSTQIKLPRKLTNTKVVGTKLFGKRKFQDGSTKTYKKSLTILTKDLYGLRLHIKALSLFKSIVDLTIWDSADQAASNSVSGRTDRQEMTFYLYLKRIDYTPNVGKVVTLIPNPNYTGSSGGTFSISEESYYNTVYSVDNDVLSLFWPPNSPGGGSGPDGYQRQPANYTEFINGRTTYSHRHDGKIYASYATDVNKLQRDFRASLRDYIDKKQRLLSGEARDYATLTIAGKLNQGPYIETFEWTGLDVYTKSTTIGWEIEIEPVYEESVDANIVVKSAIDSITEIYDDFLAIPHTAGVLTTFDARYFTSIPQRAYDTRLLKVKIPSNYNPYSKTYDGIWDGNFNLGWTDNPAWCFYDLITNRRYGLGKYVDPNLTDKWTLYEIGQYCDQLVNDGKGSLEPRFTCNVLISSREDAYKVVNDMASIFRAIVFYNAGLIFTSQDRPKDPLYIFNNSNVKEGEFTYSNTSKRVRRNVALVRYNDKDNFYKPAVKYVESREGLIRFGIKETEVSAFGCTSEGQAERLGKWTLLSENLESELVNFETSLPAMYLKPGDIVYIQDQNRQNKILGGRTYELNKNYAILDVKYEDISGFLPAINGCNFNVLTPAGNIEIGTESGNAIVSFNNDNNSVVSIVGSDGQSTLVSGLNTSLIRRNQVQTIKYESDYTMQNKTDTNVFGNYLSLEQSGTFQGYTRINFGGQSLDDTQHTLIQNTVWTIEINPINYDYDKSPSVSGFSDPNPYAGRSLEPYIDKTQKFRILDIEEQEEYRYKITALQYDELKFELGDDI